MKCPGCGAMASVASLEKGECSYCHAALPKPAREEPAKVVHVTKVEIRGPDVEDLGEAAGHVVGSVTARLAGCFTGCLSTLLSLVIVAVVAGLIAWQTWLQTRHLPSPGVTHPPPAPAPAAPAPPRKGGKRH